MYATSDEEEEEDDEGESGEEGGSAGAAGQSMPGLMEAGLRRCLRPSLGALHCAHSGILVPLRLHLAGLLAPCCACAGCLHPSHAPRHRQS